MFVIDSWILCSLDIMIKWNAMIVKMGHGWSRAFQKFPLRSEHNMITFTLTSCHNIMKSVARV